MIFLSTDPRDPAPTTEQLTALAAVHKVAEHLMCLAERIGVVVTIEQKPLQPLAMGNYESVPTVRLARVRA